MFEFVFKMFSEGDTVIPAMGMGKIAEQMAEGLTAAELVLNEKVITIDNNTVETLSGNKYNADKVLIATDGNSLPAPFKTPDKPCHNVTNIYFTAAEAPFSQPLIALNALPDKLVNNITVMNNISAAYAPAGRSLISISVIPGYHGNDLPAKVIAELQPWFAGAAGWKHLKTYNIPYGLPNDVSVVNELPLSTSRLSDSCFICGDHLLNGSINAAMKSGRLAAEAIIKL